MRRPAPSRRVLLDGAVLAVSALFVAPFTFLVGRAGRDLDRTLEILGSRVAFGPLWRTLQLGVLVTAITVVVGTATAWLVERTDLPGRQLLRIALPLPLVLPSFVGAAALLNTFNNGGLLDVVFGLHHLPDLRGLPGATVVLAALSYPYVYLPVAARVRSLNPSLEESARLLGRSPGAVFVQIVLPQLGLAISAGALLVFLYTVSDFGAVQLARYDTLTRTIYESRLLDPGASAALGLLLAAVAVLLVAGERRLGRRLRAVPAGRIRPSVRRPLGRWRVPAAAGVWSVVAFSLGAPLVVLVWWVARGVGAGQSLTGSRPLWPAVTGTAVSGIGAALLCVALTFPIAWAGVRRPSGTTSLAAAVVTAGFALPGLVLALALVQWFIGTPLYQSLQLLVLAHAIHFGAQALRASQVAVSAVPVRLDEAARLLGAGRWRRATRIGLPLMLPGLAAAGGLVLLSVLKELPTTLLLRPAGLETLSLRIWSAAEDAFMTRLGFAGLVLVALSAVLTWLLVLRPAQATR